MTSAVLPFAEWLWHGAGREMPHKTLADLSGISVSRIITCANGRRKLGIITLRRIAKGLGIKTHELVREVEDWKYKPIAGKSVYSAGAYAIKEKPMKMFAEAKALRLSSAELVPPNRYSPMVGELYKPPVWRTR